MAVVKPGTGKVVTAAIDVEIVDSFGCDVFGGSLYNLSSVGVAQYAPMVSGGTFVARPVTNGLRLSIAGNSAVNASGNIYVVLKRD